jgi:hypothetical protein
MKGFLDILKQKHEQHKLKPSLNELGEVISPFFGVENPATNTDDKRAKNKILTKIIM